jgi:hypothetical protein
MNTRRILGLLALLAACRSTAGGGGPIDETDAGGATVDVPAANTDAAGGMDRRCVPSGMENTNATCGDGIDNDCNGFFDCNDFACSRNVAVNICPDAGFVPRDAPAFRDVQRVDSAGCMRMGSESSATACGDGIDNDCDGFVDCNDSNCSCVGTCPGALLNCTCMGAEDNNGACGDGVDNDCNNFRDCNDFSCSRNSAVSVCGDGGVADAGARDVLSFRDATRVDSAGCTMTGMENTAMACADGVDNDCDGFRDCDDRNCSCIGACPAALNGCTCRGAEDSNTACGDGVDNDCNSFVDCRDFSCSRNTAVNVCATDGAVRD